MAATLLLALGPLASAQQTVEATGPAALLARQTHGATRVVTIGSGMERAYIFLPAGPALPAGAVPLVLFHHGWQGMNPKNFGALLDHLAREGNVVVYPVYQENDATSPQRVVAAAAASELAGLRWLEANGFVPDPQRVVYFGYSMGAAISLKLAVTAKDQGLPVPQALVLAAPGDAYHVARGPDSRSIWPDLRLIPSTLPVAIVTGADDHAIGYPTARKLAAGLCPVRPARLDRRVLLVLPSDTHNGVHVNAGHASPGAPDSRFDWEADRPAGQIPHELEGRDGFEASASLNQLDFYGYWRVLDEVIDSLRAAPSSSPGYLPPPSVFRNGTPGRLSLGTWPDGTPYAPAHVEQPCKPE